MLLKVLFTVAIIAAVWFGFRLAHKWLSGSAGGSAKPNVDDQASSERPREQIEDLARCAVCETYVDATGNPDCRRADCPMTGGTG